MYELVETVGIGSSENEFRKLRIILLLMRENNWGNYKLCKIHNKLESNC